MTIKDITFGVIAGSLAILLFIERSCHNIEKNRLIDDAVNYRDSAEHYKLKVNGQSVDIAFNQALQLDNRKQLESIVAKYDTLARMVAKFKNVQNVTIIKGGAQITHDTIRIDHPIPCDFKPFVVRRDSAHYRFVGTVAPDYFTIDSLTIPNTQGIVIGSRRMGFLKRPEYRVEITNSNPLMKTTNIGSFTVKTPRKWFERPVIMMGVGAVAGAYIYKVWR